MRREVRSFDEEQTTSIVALDGQTHLGDIQVDFLAGYNWAKWDGGLGTALQARFDQRFTTSYRRKFADLIERLNRAQTTTDVQSIRLCVEAVNMMLASQSEMARTLREVVEENADRQESNDRLAA